MPATSDGTLTSERRLRIAQAVLLAYWLLLFVGTHIPLADESAGYYLPGDKYLHVIAYAGLSFLIMTALLFTRRRVSWPAGLAVIALVAAYGAFDERTQLLVARHASMEDWYADVIGGIAGVLLFQFTMAPWARQRGWAT